MSLLFEGRAVAEIFTDAEGRAAGLRYDPRWLATPGAFPIARSLPLGPGDLLGPRAAEWARNLSLDGARPFEERLDIGPNEALFGALTLTRDGLSEPDAEGDACAATRRIEGLAEGALEAIGYLRALGARVGIAMTELRIVGSAAELRRADRIEKDGRVRRLPLELVAFGQAPVRSATLFRRLDGVLGAPDRLALFERIAFAALIGVDAPAVAIRLDGAPRLAPVGADWTGLAKRLSDRGLDLSVWRDFALKAGLNKTFAPRRVQALAARMVERGGAAAQDAQNAAPSLDQERLEAVRHALDARLAPLLETP